MALKQSDRVQETNIIKSIGIANGYNSKVIDRLIRKHSLIINNKWKLVNTVKEDNSFIATEYTNMTPVSYTHLPSYQLIYLDEFVVTPITVLTHISQSNPKTCITEHFWF